MTYEDIMMWVDFGAAIVGLVATLLALFMRSWPYDKRTFYMAWGIFVMVSLK